MSRISTMFFAAATLVWCSLSLLSAAEPTADKDGWITIFAGKNLDDWKIAEEDKKSFSLQEGAIVAKGPRSHAFYVGSDKPFKNFEFKAQVMTKENSNGGIFFHTKYQETDWPKVGHECQVNNTYKSDPQKTGGVYNKSKVLEAPAKDNEWFNYYIKVEGKRVVVKINDKEVVDYSEGECADTRCVGEGTFALQAHDPGSTVFYRNIQVKRLP